MNYSLRRLSNRLNGPRICVTVWATPLQGSAAVTWLRYADYRQIDYDMIECNYELGSFDKETMTLSSKSGRTTVFSYLASWT